MWESKTVFLTSLIQIPEVYAYPDMAVLCFDWYYAVYPCGMIYLPYEISFYEFVYLVLYFES